MPTTASKTYSNQRLQPIHGHAQSIIGKLVASKNYPRGSRVAKTATPGTFDLVTGAAAWDGIVAYDYTTDAAGNITMSKTASYTAGDEQNGYEPGAIININGTYDTYDLPSFTAAILGYGPTGSRMLTGSADAQGVLYIP